MLIFLFARGECLGSEHQHRDVAEMLGGDTHLHSDTRQVTLEVERVIKVGFLHINT